MRAELESRAQAAVEACRKAGADDVWADAGVSRDVEFGYRDGALEKVKDTTSRRLSVRIYANGRYSSHQTTDLEPGRLRDFLAEAVALTGALEPDPHRRITPAALYANRPVVNLDLVDPSVGELDRERRLAWCAALDDAARAHERVISATAGVYDGNSLSVAVSSNGFSGSRRSTYCWLGSSVTLRDRGDRRASDGFYAGGTHVEDLPDAGGIARAALERALARLDAEKGPTLKAPMLVDSRAAAALVSRLLQSANARSVQQNQSFFGSLLGEQAFSDALTIVDDPLIPRGLASRTYDDEGIAARELSLVRNGVVENLYVDTYYGAKGGLEPTTGTPSNRRVVPGTASLAELLAEAGEGIYVTSWLGGNADGTTGDFSLGLRGHLIEGGAIGGPVGEMNVTGNLAGLFGRLVAVGNDPYPYSTTRAPSLLFDAVDLSGTGH